MPTDTPDKDRRAQIGVWAEDNGFELLDDRDQEAERLPLFVIQCTVDHDVHNVCLGLWESTEVVLFDLRRGDGRERIDSTGATIAHPSGLPTTVILHPVAAENELMLSSLPVIDDNALEGAFQVRSEHGRIRASPRHRRVGRVATNLARPAAAHELRAGP